MNWFVVDTILLVGFVDLKLENFGVGITATGREAMHEEEEEENWMWFSEKAVKAFSYLK